jgi:hypothetical protein
MQRAGRLGRCPRCLDQHGARVTAADLADATVMGGSQSRLAHPRVQPEIADQLLRAVEPADVADRRHDAGGDDQIHAHSSDGHTLTTSMPLLDGARHWQALGAPSTAGIVTIWSSGSSHWSLRSTIGQAAKLTVSINKSGRPIFVPHKVQ